LATAAGNAIGDADAGVVELVDAPDSKSGSARSVGSIPTTRTTFLQVIVLGAIEDDPF
jgi:hypothetical protein